MLKNTLLAGAASFFMISAAQAADFEAPPAAYDWSGFYLGLHAGYGWGDSDWEADNGAENDHNIDGFVGGLHAGFNFQADSLVFGLEGDIDYADVDGDGDCVNPAFECSTETDWLASVRARAGFAVDNLLIFATGGVAFSEFDFENDDGLGNSDSQSESAVGYVVGGGGEYAFSQDLSVRAEVLYYDFGSIDFDFDNSAFDNEADVDLLVVRGGITWHFGAI